ncbi:MAG TPA: GDSL-type esterase/lipase family protein [Opitutaceae bacterium]|nr:GDSL-type esterase/lipase family protein [Opitutaceae bacterium]
MSFRTLLLLTLAVAARAAEPGNAAASHATAHVPPLNPSLPTIFIAGDSTAAHGRGAIQQGWGVPFADYFDPAKVNVANRAHGGRSSRTYLTGGDWGHLLAEVKPGDVVLIQFGQNDGGAINDEPPPPLRARGSLHGLGDETREIDNVLTKKHEIVHTFGWYLREMIDETKSKGASPVVLGLTVRDRWKDGRIERGPGRYSAWSYDVAKAAHVPFVDVTDTVADEYEAMGQEKTKALYQQDFVHFNAIGADLHAAAVVAGLKGLRPNLVAKYLSPKGEAVVADRSAYLRLPFPQNPALPSLFLAGDSTVRNGTGEGGGGQWGWGHFLPEHFDQAKINVVNRAVGGTGIQTFRALGYWHRLLSLVKPGDFVMIQFGHNDNPPRGPLPGTGNETGERMNPRTKEQQLLHTWGWYLKQDIADVRARGATPLVCSLIPRKIWKNDRIVRNKDTFAGWAERVAADEHVPFLDLNERIAERYDALGEAKVNALFADPHTHTSAEGARLNANVVVEALRALVDNPLTADLLPSNTRSAAPANP